MLTHTLLPTRIRRSTRAALPLLAAASLAGCGGGLKATLGLNPSMPNAFAVTTQAPLSMPPDYALRPPEPGAPRPQAISAARSAEGILAPQSVLASQGGAMSPGQQALLQAAGPPAPANIRAEVNAAAGLSHRPQSFVDRLMFWRGPPTQGIVVDPAREAQRLRQDAALGKPATAGTTPIQQPKSPGLFQRLFGWL